MTSQALRSAETKGQEGGGEVESDPLRRKRAAWSGTFLGNGQERKDDLDDGRSWKQEVILQHFTRRIALSRLLRQHGVREVKSLPASR
jgi:hypothetical protein